MTATAVGTPARRADPAVVAACIAILAWGAGPVLIRGMSADAYAITFFRMALAVPVMFVAARVAGEKVTGEILRMCLVPGILFGGGMLLGFAAFRSTSIANATLIGALTPAIVLLGAGRFVGERTDRSRLPFAFVSVAGMALVVLAGSSSSGASLRGDLLAVLNLFTFTAYFVMMKGVRNKGVGSWAFLAGVFAIGTCVVAPVCAVLTDDLGAVGGKGLDPPGGDDLRSRARRPRPDDVGQRPPPCDDLVAPDARQPRRVVRGRLDGLRTASRRRAAPGRRARAGRPRRRGRRPPIDAGRATFDGRRALTGCRIDCGPRIIGSRNADVAQLVEHHLAKVRVAGSNPVVRSTKPLVRAI